MDSNSDISLIELRKRNKNTFEQVFFAYSEGLVRYAESYVYDRNEAEDIVQSLFTHLWENAENIHINTSIKAYLYTSTKNRCLNVIRHLGIRDKHKLLYLETLIFSQEVDEGYDKSLYKKLERAIDQLPERMHLIFKMKYLEGKKITDISQELSVTENTIKTQLKRARKKLSQMMITPMILLIILILIKY